MCVCVGFGIGDIRLLTCEYNHVLQQSLSIVNIATSSILESLINTHNVVQLSGF